MMPLIAIGTKWFFEDALASIDMLELEWALAGGSAYTMMLFLLAECSRYWHFMLCLGVVGGFSVALIQTAALSCIGHCFKRRRGLATGVDVIIPLLLQ